MSRRLPLFLIAFALLPSCVSLPYFYGTGRIEQDLPLSPPVEQQMLYGQPNDFLDASDWFWPGSLLGKLILWDKDVDAHEISPQTVAAMQDYLDRNDLRNVQVYVNRYDPGDQWDRLFANETVGAGWRYTLGVLSVAFYTIIPGRFFGGDAYNPFTNTVYLYSDDPMIALHEAGHAKDWGRRVYKGTHAALYLIPFAPLYYEANATSDALTYLEQQGDMPGKKDGYEILYPAYGTYVAGIGGAIGGHVVGQIMSSGVEVDDLPPEVDADGEPASVD